MRTRIIGLWFCTALVLLWSSSSPASPARMTPRVRAIERAKAAVVNIHSEKSAGADRENLLHGTPGRKINGMGSGIIVDERGYIVTNQHVIADVESLRVTLYDNSTYQARVISYDRKHDLAIIKVDPTRRLQVIPLGTSSDVMLGEDVIAIGNAFGYEHSVTSGIVSALSRDVEVNETQAYKNLLQVDAAINPGNSGGPLLNLDGEVIGINVAIRAGAQKIGFAIPIDDARKFIAKLLDTGRLNDTYHGLVTHDVKAASTLNLIVDSAEPNSPAAASGFQAGDIVVEAGDVKILDQADLERAFLGHTAGDSIDVTVRRDQESVTLKVQLTQVPAHLVRNNPQIAVKANAESIEEKAWRVLGVKLLKVPAASLQHLNRPYNGGMQVQEVRADGPAARGGVRKGDVLVGLHQWETISNDNLAYIINHPQLGTFNPLKYYVVREQETLYGELRLTLLPK